MKLNTIRIAGDLLKPIHSSFWFTLMLAQIAVAQVRDVDIVGAGARAEGMGGAFIGLADDATALSWNPAGLTQLEKPEASVVLRQSYDGYKFKSDFVSGVKTNSNHVALNFLSVAYPTKIGERNLTFALAYQRQMDLHLATKSSDFDEKQTGGVGTVSPGLAYPVVPSLSLGVSSNIWFGSSKYDYEDFTDPANSLGYKDDWSGFNYQVGVLFEAEKTGMKLPLRIGFNFRSPFSMTDKWKFTSFDDGQKYKWEWEFPSMFGFGASYRIGENLILAADYELRGFGDSKVKKVDDPGGSGTSFDFSPSKKDINPIRVGAEYLIVTESVVIPIRIGFRTAPTFFADTDINDLPSKQVKGTAWSLGTGYIHSRFAFDVAMTSKSYKQKDNFLVNTRRFSNITLSASTIFYF